VHRLRAVVLEHGILRGQDPGRADVSTVSRIIRSDEWSAGAARTVSNVCWIDECPIRLLWLSTLPAPAVNLSCGV
jgi:hypothetical protein